MMKRLNRQQAAEYLTERSGKRYTRGILEQKACRGGGPKYEIVDGQASYAPSNLDAFLNAATETPEEFKERRRLAREAARARRQTAAPSLSGQAVPRPADVRAPAPRRPTSERVGAPG